MTFELGTLVQPSFMALVGVGIVLSLLFVALRHRIYYPTPSFLQVFDVCLVASAGGILGAKFGYMILYRTQWSAGGLSWHGGLLGAVIVLSIMSRWRKLDQALLWDSVAWCVPLIMLMAWWGCLGATCGFGREVESLADYPAWMVWEGRDLTNTLAPRFATQTLGMSGAVVVWLILAVIAQRRLWVGRWFGLVILMFSAIMFGLGFLRGDPAIDVGGLRIDQALDIVMMIGGAVMGLTRPSVSQPIRQSST